MPGVWPVSRGGRRPAAPGGRKASTTPAPARRPDVDVNSYVERCSSDWARFGRLGAAEMGERAMSRVLRIVGVLVLAVVSGGCFWPAPGQNPGRTAYNPSETALT